MANLIFVKLRFVTNIEICQHLPAARKNSKPFRQLFLYISQKTGLHYDVNGKLAIHNEMILFPIHTYCRTQPDKIIIPVPLLTQTMLKILLWLFYDTNVRSKYIHQSLFSMFCVCMAYFCLFSYTLTYLISSEFA